MYYEPSTTYYYRETNDWEYEAVNLYVTSY